MASKAERDAYVEAVRRRLIELESGPDLTLEELLSFSTEELIAYMELFDVVIDETVIDAEIDATMGTYLASLERGEPMDAAKQEDLEKRIDTSTSRVAAVTTKSAMGQTRAQIMEQEDPRDELDRVYQWLSALRRPCRSCEERHGQQHTMEEWQILGVPRSGGTLCGSNCECELMPVGFDRTSTRARVDAVNKQGPRRQVLARAGV